MTTLAEVTSIEDLVNDLPRFVSDLTAFAELLDLNLSDFNADHISLRCHQIATADRWKAGLLNCGELFSSAQINGREICLFNLDSPLLVGPWHIDCIELPYPGNKRYPHEGWEHVELVLEGNTETLFERAISALSDAALTTPGISIKQSSPKGEGERLENPTLAVTNGSITIKFHPHHIRDIVMSERQ